jgi:hypothetical protein
LYVCACSIAHLALISQEKASFKAGLRDTPASVIVIVISLAAAGALYLLCSYHIRLASTNTTTNEDYKLNESPYDMGRRTNCLNALFGVRPPTRYGIDKLIHHKSHHH